MQLTLSEILDLPSVRAGDPEVVCSGPMDQPVRWVHVSDLADLSGLLTGGELVLTTGQALADPARRDAYLPGLADAGATGVVIELGLHIDALPESVRAIGLALSLPVIVLHRPVRFIDVTEEVHRRIVADQYAEVAYGQRVHEAFTALSMRRASADQIVGAAAEMLDTPVVLEDLNRQVLAFDGRGVPTAVLLADWERRSRLATGDAWTACPVGPYREEWGRLIAPGIAANARATMALERAAQALALHRMVEQNRSSLELRAQSGLVDDLRHGRITDEAEATARAHGLGLRPTLTYVPMTVRLREGAGADQVAVAQRRLRTLDAIMHAVRAAGHTGLTSTRDDGQIDLVLAPQRTTGALETALHEVCSAIRRAVCRLDGADDCVIGAGPESSRLVDAVGGLREAGHVAEVAMSMPLHNKPFHRSSDVRLRGLLSLIRTDPRVQAFAETELAGLLAHRAKHGDEAFELLRRFLAAGGNKAELARALHMSRPTLYARLDALQRIIGLDLDDAESRTSLHVAMLIVNPAGE
ncbi:PucR family transcriptional regulator ligand-binding domain-containing protein [Mycobacterium sp. CVI_P3]|uniref:PucR family transcriptional regulator ligand-binding domain-containing protein n=1 Tax=Mycobacterium pinniadriaticum TaxID=2994102 RepID=A0ABT3S8U8_9MYCO|nr:PucR family transcriptional regulator ligand-binding domain-containing protein [Mycobacterium pinniadriaticum]MCX2929502.1 PucR family transcriptional regulator ligand-binding domain-containing protein [Mycobacterium pinniadriaticum]MCX2935926.1 PucR family transcriptional regulator ligand-binding domain-containing protein [Mycobacterium pinniadriaticum]